MPSSVTTIISKPLPEGSSRPYETVFVDRSGQPIDSGSVTAIAVTLVDVESGWIVNSRNAQNVLGANGGALSAGGVFTLQLTPNDTVSIGTGKFQERRMTFSVTYTLGVERHQVTWWMDNLADVG